MVRCTSLMNSSKKGLYCYLSDGSKSVQPVHVICRWLTCFCLIGVSGGLFPAGIEIAKMWYAAGAMFSLSG